MPSVSVPAIASVAAAGIGAAGSIMSSGAQAQGAQNAANTQQQMNAQNNATQMAMYNQSRQDLLPYMAGGAGAYSQLQGLLGINGGGGGGGGAGYGNYGAMPGAAAAPSYGASGTSLVNALNSMGQTEAGSRIQQMISSGASPQQIQYAIQTWGQHTTSPTNAAGKANVFQALQGLQLSAPATAAAPSNAPSYSGPMNGALAGLQSTLSPTGALGGMLSSNGGTEQMQAQLKNYPGYQWALSQGQAAQDASAAARGLTLSGGQIAANQQYGQGMANQLYGQYFNQQNQVYNNQNQLYNQYAQQLLQASSLGENAAAMSGNQGVQTGSAIGNQGVQAGSQIGAAQYGSGLANASGIASATNQIGGILSNQNLMGQLFNNGGGSGGIPLVGITPDAYGNYVSDRRAKTAIRKIGRLDSGLPVYSYRYKGSPLPQIGVMADDVEKVAPEAVSLGRDGYKRVSYAKVSQLPAMRSAA